VKPLQLPTPTRNSSTRFQKNHGISFLSIDSSETRLQLLHHPSLIGGSWISPEQQLVAVLGCDEDARPVEIVRKSLKDVKGKSHSFHKFALGLDSVETFHGLRNPKLDFHYKNLIPLPHSLTKNFIELPTTDPVTVAIAFFNAIIAFDVTDPIDPKVSSTLDVLDSLEHMPTETVTPSNDQSLMHATIPEPNYTSSTIQDCLHIIQFCHLCTKGKVPPITYVLSSSVEAKNWYQCLLVNNGLRLGTTKCHIDTPDSPDSDTSNFGAKKILVKMAILFLLC
jgi:hypothetical protein